MGKCTGGAVNQIEVAVPTDDCNCVGIKKAVWSINEDGERILTMEFTNGQSFTSPNLQGEKGDKGDTGPAGATGATGAVVIWNEETDVDNGTTTGSYVLLHSGATDHTNVNENLVNVGDYIEVYGMLEKTDPDSGNSPGVRLAIGNVQLGGNQSMDNNISRIIYKARISLTDNTVGAMKIRVQCELYYFVKFGSGYVMSGNNMFSQNTQDVTTINSVNIDFSTTDYTFTLSAFCSASNEVNSPAFSGIVNKVL